MRYPTPARVIEAVRGVSFTLGREKLGIVGESGSGKSTVGRAILRLVPAPGVVSAERLVFDGIDLLAADAATLRAVRGRRITMVMQDPKFSLNPVMTVGRQIGEAYRAHGRSSRAEARRRALEVLAAVKIRDPERVYERYPHEVSGGMGQRVMIAMMLVADPDVLIADEPTSALDVTVQMQVLAILDDLVSARGLGLIFISHDLNLVASFCDRVLIMYAGRVVETCRASELHRARHPYTRGLLAALPQVDREPGPLPVLTRDPAWLDGPPVADAQTARTGGPARPPAARFASARRDRLCSRRRRRRPDEAPAAKQNVWRTEDMLRFILRSSRLAAAGSAARRRRQQRPGAGHPLLHPRDRDHRRHLLSGRRGASRRWSRSSSSRPRASRCRRSARPAPARTSSSCARTRRSSRSCRPCSAPGRPRAPACSRPRVRSRTCARSRCSGRTSSTSSSPRTWRRPARSTTSRSSTARRSRSAPATPAPKAPAGRSWQGLGIDPDQVFEVAYMGYTPTAEALQNGTIKGANLPGGVPVSAVAQAFAAMGDDLVILELHRGPDRAGQQRVRRVAALRDPGRHLSRPGRAGHDDRAAQLPRGARRHPGRRRLPDHQDHVREPAVPPQHPRRDQGHGAREGDRRPADAVAPGRAAVLRGAGHRRSPTG